MRGRAKQKPLEKVVEFVKIKINLFHKILFLQSCADFEEKDYGEIKRPCGPKFYHITPLDFFFSFFYNVHCTRTLTVHGMLLL